MKPLNMNVFWKYKMCLTRHFKREKKMTTNTCQNVGLGVSEFE